MKEVGIGSVLKTEESNFGSDGTFDGDFEIVGEFKVVELVDGDDRGVDE